MNDFVLFGSRQYALGFLLLLAGRGMDFLSTWIATPNLVLEGNPIAKRLGWRWGIPLNIGICFGLAFWPVSAMAVSTTSFLVAARNFQSAWLMRSMGEEHYRDWHVARIQETRVTLYLFCLAGNTLPIALIGFAIIYFSTTVVPFAIGMGVVAYAGAVAFYTVLATWRLRRTEDRQRKRLQKAPLLFANGAAIKKSLSEAYACERTEPEPK
jgi:hypothetical protein